MKKHIKIYYDAFGFFYGEPVLSEISDSLAVDIHHIDSRGMGGTKNNDRIENLMALTRVEHDEYGDVKEYKAMLYKIHKRRMQIARVRFDEEWIDKQIKKYE